jgi:hypothetical protein
MKSLQLKNVAAGVLVFLAALVGTGGVYAGGQKAGSSAAPATSVPAGWPPERKPEFVEAFDRDYDYVRDLMAKVIPK